jgi:tRNA dimethylallyltransferase
MINEGLIEEAKYFYDKKINSKAIMTPICYKELFEYFNNNCDLETAIELIKQRSRRYAKRQYTFFNHQLPVKWFDVDFNNFNNTVNEVYNYIKKAD